MQKSEIKEVTLSLEELNVIASALQEMPGKLSFRPLLVIEQALIKSQEKLKAVKKDVEKAAE